MIFIHAITNLAMPNPFNENRMLDVRGEQAVRNLNEIVKWSLQCNRFWMVKGDTLKVCQALSKTVHSVASSIGYFIEIC